MTADPEACSSRRSGWPTRCCGRATSCTRTGRRRPRTRCAGSTACSRRGPTAEADGYERWAMQTECLLEFGLEATVDVRLRYLQVQARTVEEAVGDGFKPVAELEVDGELWASWDEAVEHMLDVTGFDLARPGGREVPINLAGRS